MAHHTSVLIIGAGQAASVLARELRSLGFSGSITLVGDETHLPYERPPLSKDVLKSSATTDSVFLQKPSSIKNRILNSCWAPACSLWIAPRVRPA
ncbi:FAD-dependent oxidoreductase [Alcaligenes faecalis]|uniref:FAD-dependent oxidoreductase n=1 Tax=Alcaligenes faecalis TaxID=511 RepID=UPI00203A8F34|nr:FAD-dependent oxidoreductase [Alcaligenes faecalis]MCM2560474.1 FAD-dependent oxidoreductase [Alcaligenes faecalis]MCM2622951.1 FAD-dependent oxidoreductase [Alcaligenes faecalis]